MFLSILGSFVLSMWLSSVAECSRKRQDAPGTHQWGRDCACLGEHPAEAGPRLSHPGTGSVRTSRVARSEESSCQYRRCEGLRFDPWVRKIPWRRKRQPTPLFPKSHGQRNLMGYPSWGPKKSKQLRAHACRKAVVWLPSSAPVPLLPAAQTPRWHCGLANTLSASLFSTLINQIFLFLCL